MSLKYAYQMDDCSSMQETILDKTPFMAPEIFAGQQVTLKTHVWNLGFMLFLCFMGVALVRL